MSVSQHLEYRSTAKPPVQQWISLGETHFSLSRDIVCMFLSCSRTVTSTSTCAGRTTPTCRERSTPKTLHQVSSWVLVSLPGQSDLWLYGMVLFIDCVTFASSDIYEHFLIKWCNQWLRLMKSQPLLYRQRRRQFLFVCFFISFFLVFFISIIHQQPTQIFFRQCFSHIRIWWCKKLGGLHYVPQFVC